MKVDYGDFNKKNKIFIPQLMTQWLMKDFHKENPSADTIEIEDDTADTADTANTASSTRVKRPRMTKMEAYFGGPESLKELRGKNDALIYLDQSDDVHGTLEIIEIRDGEPFWYRYDSLNLAATPKEKYVVRRILEELGFDNTAPTATNLENVDQMGPDCYWRTILVKVECALNDPISGKVLSREEMNRFMEKLRFWGMAKHAQYARVLGKEKRPTLEAAMKLTTEKYLKGIQTKTASATAVVVDLEAVKTVDLKAMQVFELEDDEPAEAVDLEAASAGAPANDAKAAGLRTSTPKPKQKKRKQKKRWISWRRGISF